MDEEIEALLDEAEDLLENGDPEEALRLARRARRLDPDSVDATFLEAEALLELGELADAEAAYRRADELLPHDPMIETSLGLTLFERCRFQEAEALLRRALATDSQAAEAHHLLGLVLERRGEDETAERHLRRARRLAPDTYPKPLRLSEPEFAACIDRALGELPEKVRRALANTAISVQEFPDEQDLLAADPPLSPQILGLWRGTPLTEKTVFDPWSGLPGEIVLYRRSLQRFSRDHADLVDQVRVTVLHEVGHALGLDEAELDDRGLA